MVDPITAPGGPTDHDRLHPVTVDDPTWTETLWFAWQVPERHLTGYFYPVFRPTLGVQAGGVLVFDASGALPWELPVFAFGGLAPMDPQLDLRHFELDNGMSLHCTHPLGTFEIGYVSEDLVLDLHYEALTEPLVTERAAPFTGAGHLDQPGRVTGRMILHGCEVDVDCFAMRDRGWGPRRFSSGIGVGYSYATLSENRAFLTVSSGRRGRERVRMGYLVRDGCWSRITGGTRRVARDVGGRPAIVEIHATDERGREVRATGRVVSRQAFTPYPSMLTWDSMVEWSFEGGIAWGEDQDVWHPRDWRDRSPDPDPLIPGIEP